MEALSHTANVSHLPEKQTKAVKRQLYILPWRRSLHRFSNILAGSGSEGRRFYLCMLHEQITQSIIKCNRCTPELFHLKTRGATLAMLQCPYWTELWDAFASVEANKNIILKSNSDSLRCTNSLLSQLSHDWKEEIGFLKQERKKDVLQILNNMNT